MRATAAILATIVLHWAPAAGAAATDAAWEPVSVEPFTDKYGIERTPSCSGAPMQIDTQTGPRIVPTSTAYRFFIRRGTDPRRLVIIWDGGGACWNATTCIGTALAGDPTYTPIVEEMPQTLAQTGGLADADDPRNPVKGATLVFIPYCTGDLHLGSADREYLLPNGVGWTIRHRGFDNVMAVLSALEDGSGSAGLIEQPQEILVAGASAGGYGVLYALPYVVDAFPQAHRIRLLADSANGVVARDLYDSALARDGEDTWGARQNLAPELQDAFDAGPRRLIPATYRSLGWYYPRVRFGQYTRAFDVSQITFLNIDRNIDDPSLWTDPAELLDAGLEWTWRARIAMWLTALTTPNYRFYLAQGTAHTTIADDSLYTEDSASGIALTSWIRDMLYARVPARSHWRNATCATDCLPQDWLWVAP